jgi:hypothetical protein
MVPNLMEELLLLTKLNPEKNKVADQVLVVAKEESAEIINHISVRRSYTPPIAGFFIS